MSYLSEIQQFIASWNDPFVSIDLTDFELFRTSPEGNINSEGTAACSDSPTVPKYYRYFKKAIEPGVKELTIAFILKLDCITYSSCQGHYATPDAVMRQRYVAVLPRDAEDYERLLNILTEIAEQTNSHFYSNPVKVAIAEDTVKSEDCEMPGLVFSFVSVLSEEHIYFRELEPVYNYVIELVHNNC
ncbi:MAG: hypothetical protein SXA11_13980 [Cyanobacteriota bacterium]|nr:hypothetical protein [Cyanobacteriota bacterium]